MYSISAFGRMIADETRIQAYACALERAEVRDRVVADIGAGTGIMTLLACRYGARRVYAIEPGDSVGVAAQVMAANGFADRVKILQGFSTEIDIPERADVVVSDLRGVLPLFARHLPSVVDARKRLLAPGGTLIPKRDTLWAALVETPQAYDEVVSPWQGNRFQLDLSAAREIVTNSWKKAAIGADQLLTEPVCWGELDYTALESPDA